MDLLTILPFRACVHAGMVAAQAVRILSRDQEVRKCVRSEASFDAMLSSEAHYSGNNC